MKILSVCGMGFGTSLMLLMEVQAIAKKHGYTVDGEATDLGSAKGQKCDFIIASSEIASQLSSETVPVVAINNLLDKKEIEQKVMPVIEQLASEEEK
jgi:PTS system ascorbate-specific IIB component